jgi:hypothetical protein
LTTVVSLQQFLSDESWSLGTGATHALPVCLNSDAPLSCPNLVGTRIDYGFQGNGWGADLGRIEGAKWIWDGGHVASNSGAQDDELVTSKLFELPNCFQVGAFFGQVHLAADDFAEVFVNGVFAGQIGSTTDPSLAGAAQQQLATFDISAFLAGGTNVVTFRAVNGPRDFASCNDFGCLYSENPAGMVFGGTLGCQTR